MEDRRQTDRRARRRRLQKVARANRRRAADRRDLNRRRGIRRESETFAAQKKVLKAASAADFYIPASVKPDPPTVQALDTPRS